MRAFESDSAPSFTETPTARENEKEHVPFTLVELPDEYDEGSREGCKNKRIGNRIIDMDKLDEKIKEHMCCKCCIEKAHTAHMKEYFEYAALKIKQVKKEAKSQKTVKQQLHVLLCLSKTPEELYKSFIHW